MNTQAVQIAKVSGLYRCIGIGQTKFANVGEELPTHICKGSSPCAWELRAEDQRPRDEFIPMFINKGLMCTGITELPEVGMHYNFHSDMFSSYDGKWVVTEVGTIKWYKKEEIHIIAEKVGEMDPLLPIHFLATMTC